TATAAWIKGITQDQVKTEQRYTAKRTTFGKFFGIGDFKLAKQTKKSLIEAHAFQDAWDSRYIRYVSYKSDIVREVRATGELVSISGRKRRFPIAIDNSWANQAINFKIQATSHDCLMSSIIEAYCPVY